MRTGGEYKPSHALRLRKLCDLFTQRWRREHPPVEFRVLSDSEDPALSDARIPLQECWLGWWSKMELFRPTTLELGESALFFDLDTEIIGDLSTIIAWVEDLPADDKLYALSDFYRAGRSSNKVAIQSSVMAWRRTQAFDEMFVEFSERADEWMPRVGLRGDQGFLEEMYFKKIIGFGSLQSVFPGIFVSYKVHCGAGVPSTAHVAVFHGKPRPWEVAPVWSRLPWT